MHTVSERTKSVYVWDELTPVDERLCRDKGYKIVRFYSGNNSAKDVVMQIISSRM